MKPLQIILILIVSIFIALAAIWYFMSGTEITKLNDHPKYLPILANKYVTMIDLALFKYSHNDKNIFLVMPGRRNTPTLAEIKQHHGFPFKYGNMTIFGYLPKNSEFRVIDVEKITRGSNVDIKYTAIVKDVETVPGYAFDISFLSTSSERNPGFAPGLVKTVKK